MDIGSFYLLCYSVFLFTDLISVFCLFVYGVDHSCLFELLMLKNWADYRIFLFTLLACLFVYGVDRCCLCGG